MLFFCCGVAAQFNDFHSVTEGTGNGFQTVCSTHEQYLRQVIGHFHIVVTEREILFPIQHFQQRRRRVAVIGYPQLVHFIQQHQRIDGAHLFHGVHDTPGHGADVCSAVTADFRFILHAAQRHAHIFPVQCLCHSTGNGCFADAGRSHQTKDGGLFLGGVFPHCQIFQNTFFHFFQTVMVFIQNFRCLFQVEGFFGHFIPGQVQQCVNITAGHVGFGRSYGNLHHTVDFLLYGFPHFFRRVLFLQTTAKFRRVSADAVFVPPVLPE